MTGNIPNLAAKNGLIQVWAKLFESPEFIQIAEESSGSAWGWVTQALYLSASSRLSPELLESRFSIPREWAERLSAYVTRNMVVGKWFDDEAAQSALEAWVAYRKQLRKPLTEPSIERIVKKYLCNPQDLPLAVEHSIQAGYQGLIPPPKGFQGSGSFSKQVNATLETIAHFQRPRGTK